MNYPIHLLTLICLYTSLAQSLNVALGYGGLLSLAHGALYGIGAYVSALLMVVMGWPFEISAAVAVIGSAALAWLVAIPATRLRGDFFVLATLGFQMIVFSTLYNWIPVTNGPHGIAGVPRLSFLGYAVETPLGLLLVAIVLATATCTLVWAMARSPYGRVLQAVRDDEIAAASLGRDVAAVKRSAFAWSAALSAVCGAFFASYSTYIDPTSFGLSESIFLMCMLIIGGAGNVRGPFVGASIVILLPELLRFVHVPDSAAPALRQIMYGLGVVVMMRLRPQGVAGKYAFE